MIWNDETHPNCKHLTFSILVLRCWEFPPEFLISSSWNSKTSGVLPLCDGTHTSRGMRSWLISQCRHDLDGRSRCWAASSLLCVLHADGQLLLRELLKRNCWSGAARDARHPKQVRMILAEERPSNNSNMLSSEKEHLHTHYHWGRNYYIINSKPIL